MGEKCDHRRHDDCWGRGRGGEPGGGGGGGKGEGGVAPGGKRAGSCNAKIASSKPELGEELAQSSQSRKSDRVLNSGIVEGEAAELCTIHGSGRAARGVNYTMQLSLVPSHKTTRG